MMRLAMQKLMITGRLGTDPKVYDSSGNVTGAFFRVAVDSGKDKSPQWYSVFCATKQVDACIKYLGKGCKVFVEGYPSYKLDMYEGKASVSVNINAVNIEFLSVKQTDSSPSDVPPSSPPAADKHSPLPAVKPFSD